MNNNTEKRCKNCGDRITDNQSDYCLDCRIKKAQKKKKTGIAIVSIIGVIITFLLSLIGFSRTTKK